jgi:predicted enzyme related to lactoylglutathione lyase
MPVISEAAARCPLTHGGNDVGDADRQDVVMPIVDSVLARVPVEDIELALPLYVALSGTSDIRRFSFRDVELAWVGNFLLLCGPPESMEDYQRVATLIVNDIGAAVTAVEANGGTVLEGPAEAPNGPRMIARHGDHAVFEYTELNQT